MSEDKYEKALREIQGATQRMREDTEVMRADNEKAFQNLDVTLAEGDLSHKATSLFARLSRWDIVPDDYKEKISAEIAELVSQARAGDENAKKILGNIKSKLDQNKIDTSPLPNLNWQEEYKK